MKTEWIYGRWLSYGWGAMELTVINNDYVYIDFDPEFETKRDVKLYWANRREILRLKNVTLLKYVKTLYRGLKLYRKLI